MTTTLSDTREPSIHMARVARPAALVVGVLVLLAALFLALFYAVGGPFGAINDGLNAAVGAASAVLAVLSLGRRRHPLDLAATALGVGGGAVFAAGAYLVLSGATGWFLAGLVSGVGAGLLGGWLIVLNRPRAAGSGLRVGVSRLGRLAGGVMLLGLLGLPGWTSGVDDWAAAPWYVNLGMLSWIGTYALYPAWCLRLSRMADPPRPQ